MTRFGYASVGKMFTAVAVAQLVEADKMAYSDPLSTYIPEYPSDVADRVTIHHLLTHTSGIVDFFECSHHASGGYGHNDACFNVGRADGRIPGCRDCGKNLAHRFSEDRFLGADPTVFDVFTIPLLQGDSRTALTRPNTIVLTEEMA